MKHIILFLIGVFFIGCGPKYVVNKEYIAPKGDGSGACVTVCEQEKSDCTFTCNQQYETCMQSAGRRANIAYQKALNSYEIAYDEYKYEFRMYKKKISAYEHQRSFLDKDYLFFKEQCEKNKEKYACKRESETWDSLIYLKRSIPHKPLPPRSPVFERILEQEQRSCQSECGCVSSFDSCYSRCGGKVLFYKECVEGCK